MGMLAMIVLARKLSPQDFGMVSIVEVLLTMIAGITTAGIPEYLLAYRKEDQQSIFNAAFWLSTSMAILLCVVFLIILPFWADFNNNETLVSIGYPLLFVFLVGQGSSIFKASLSKGLDFRKQVRIQYITLFALPITKVILALFNFGVYSLIIPAVIFTPIESLLLYRSANFKIRWSLGLDRWKEIFKFTKSIIANSLIVNFTDNLDKILLAKFLDLSSLGVYNLAWTFANFFTSNIVSVTNGILSAILPKYTTVEELREQYFKFLNLMVVFIGFAIFYLGFGAKTWVLALYGEKWMMAVVPVQIISVYAFFRALTSSYGSIVNTFHQPQKSLIVNIFYTPCHMLGSIAGIYFGGVIGLAISVTLVRLIFIQWGITQVMHLLHEKFIDYYKRLSKSLGYILTFIILSVIISFIAERIYSGVATNIIVLVIIVPLYFGLLYYFTSTRVYWTMMYGFVRPKLDGILKTKTP
jgi:O-antigen/teichoic acid export membrane protein